MGGRYSKHRADRTLFHVQSTSLDSISTTVSLSTCQNGNVPTHSPSMDTIHQRSGKQPMKQMNGNTYMLLDTVSTDYEAASLLEEERTGVSKGRGGEGGGKERGAAGSGGREVEGKGKGNDKALKDGRLAEEGREEERGGEETHLTSSLPSEVERHIGRGEVVDEFSQVLPARDGQMDGESSTNKMKTCPNVSQTTDASEMEREVQQLLKSILKQSRQASKNGYSNSSDTTTASEVPEAVLQLSSKDLDQLAMYLCSKFKDTLQTSLVKRVLQQQQKEHQMKQRTKHVQISEDPVSFGTATEGSDSPHSPEFVAGQHGRSGEERLQRRRPRRPRRERPNSTPNIYWKDDPHLNLSDPQSNTSGRLAHDSPSPPHLQTRSHSHEDCYHHKCNTDQSPDTTYGCSRQPQCRGCREHCRHSPNREHPHSGGRKKRQGRSRDTPVDVSLDDNCPGVNLVRRRQHQHHHSVCENCLQSFGKGSSRHNRRRPKQQHSFEMPNCKDPVLSEEDPVSRGVGEGVGFITLDQLRTVAQMLHSSAGIVEQQQQQQQQQKGGQGSGPMKSQSFRHERRHQYQVKSKRKSAHLDDAVSGSKMELVLEDNDIDPCLSTPEELTKLQELVYPAKSRSGRDSPATDMAVINLSVDSPCMLQPLEGREGKEPPHSSTSVFFDNSSPDRVMHLHHHYHHIIHHGEP